MSTLIALADASSGRALQLLKVAGVLSALALVGVVVIVAGEFFKLLMMRLKNILFVPPRRPASNDRKPNLAEYHGSP